MPEKKSTSAANSTSSADLGTDLGRASYRAEQARDAVIIFAFGWNPTPGYTNFFEQSPIDVFPPEFIFRSVPPGGIVPQVITPFAIWVMFGASEPVKTVTVQDADGPHEIPVEQMSEALAAAMQRATWVSGHVVRGGGGVGGRASTLGIGEEEPGPTWAQGEEDFLRMGAGVGGRASTMGIGEEEPGPTTMAVGEEDFRAPTTMATGEEGGGPTTMATGEEERVAGAAYGGGPITTLALGEEATATTLRLGEENVTTFAVGEEGVTTAQAATTLDIGEESTQVLRSTPFGSF